MKKRIKYAIMYIPSEKRIGTCAKVRDKKLSITMPAVLCSGHIVLLFYYFIILHCTEIFNIAVLLIKRGAEYD